MSSLQISQSLNFLKSKGLSVNDSKLFDEFTYIKQAVLIASREDGWNELLAHKKWSKIFNESKSPEVLKEFRKVCGLVFSFFGHNADNERIFSAINETWTDDRNSMLIETVAAVSQLDFNVDISPSQFYIYLLKDENRPLLNAIGSNDKHKKI